MGLEDARRGRRPPLRRTGAPWVRQGDGARVAAHPTFPSYGYTITRFDLDALVAAHAASRGASVVFGAEVTEPFEFVPPCATTRLARCRASRRSTAPRASRPRPCALRRGRRRRELPPRSRARCVEAAGVADGHGAARLLDLPRHDDRFIESHIDIRDAEDNVVPGYGWVFPLGDGRVNSGSPAVDGSNLEGREHDQAHGGVLGPARPELGDHRGDVPRSGDRRQAPDGALGWSAHRGERRRHRRCRGLDQPVQRRGIAYGYGPVDLPGRPSRPRCSGTTREPRVLRRAAGLHVRRLLQGRAWVRPSHL